MAKKKQEVEKPIVEAFNDNLIHTLKIKVMTLELENAELKKKLQGVNPMTGGIQRGSLT